ncbi:MAG: transcriptional repressor [Spirochaetes bacterium]|nr:transcriptional repressor [Spirochaetota bacterium]
MGKSGYAGSIKEITGLFKEHNILPSVQRIKVYQYILEHSNHPTADQIYRALIKTIPSLSKTTVYNSIRILADNDIITELQIENNELRYDANLKLHAHFKCTICGTIYDIELSEADYELIDKKIKANGYHVKQHNFISTGICSTCYDRKNSLHNV